MTFLLFWSVLLCFVGRTLKSSGQCHHRVIRVGHVCQRIIISEGVCPTHYHCKGPVVSWNIAIRTFGHQTDRLPDHIPIGFLAESLNSRHMPSLSHHGFTKDFTKSRFSFFTLLPGLLQIFLFAPTVRGRNGLQNETARGLFKGGAFWHLS